MKKKVWFKQLGYTENPFTIKPGASNFELEGYSKAIQKLLSGIKKGEIWFVEGAYGIGKTSTLKNIIHKFGGKKRLVYYSANRAESGINFDSLLMGRTMFNKMFKVMPKDMILMLDEAQNMIRTDFEQIEKLMEAGNISSVIFVSDDIRNVKFTPHIKKLLGAHLIQLSSFFGEKQAVSMIKKRMNGEKFLSDDVIKHIYSKSGKNPRNMLENTEDLTKYVIDELEEDKITITHCKEYFGKK